MEITRFLYNLLAGMHTLNRFALVYALPALLMFFASPRSWGEGYPTNLSDFANMKNQLGSSSPLSSPLLPGMGASITEPLSSVMDPNGMFQVVNDSFYIIGPGDYLTMGFGTKTVFLPVNPEGNVVIENVGPVMIGGKSLAEAKRIMLVSASKVYRSDKLFVTLSKSKKIQVSLVGAVANPGLYVLNGTARLTECIGLAGGITTAANNKVSIRNQRGETHHYDLDRYFRGNDLSQNPYLTAGDQVKFEEIDYDHGTVEIREHDQVAVLQLKDGQSAFDLIAAYFVTRKTRNWQQLLVYQGGELKATLTKKESQTFIPEPGSILEVQTYTPLVFVTGAVMRPAGYEYNVNFNAMDYISSAGILTTSGDITELEVIDGAGRLRKADSSKDKIAPGDHILVPQSKESRARDWLPLLVAVASLVSSIALTLVTIEVNKN